MSTTVGHAISGVICLLSKRKLVPASTKRLTLKEVTLFVVLANLPDLDMIVSYILTGQPLYYHGQVSHSLFFVCAVGFLVMLLVSEHRSIGAWLLYTSPMLLHVLMDSLTGPVIGLMPSRGVCLLWPIIADPIAFPVTLMNGPHHDTWKRLFDMYNVRVMAYEVLFFTPFLVVAWLAWWRRKDV